MIEDALLHIIHWFFTNADDDAPEATRAPRWLHIVLLIGLIAGASVVTWLMTI